MGRLTFKTRIPASAQKLFAWHARPGALRRLSPPWASVELVRHDGIRDGDRAVLRLGLGPLRVRWIAEHFGYEEGRQFCDRQVEGPFARWEHTHRMEPDGPNASYLIDDIEYELPLGGLGDTLGDAAIRQEMNRQFAYRHRITQSDMELHEQYNPEGRSLRIAVSGASGLVGSQLTAFLETGGHEVWPMVRERPGEDEQKIYWNHREKEIDAEKLEGMDAVIHLAGENVFAVRWTEEKKKRILASRVEGTRLVAEALAKLDAPPKVFLVASAIGYYGDRGDEKLTEESAPGEKGFLPAVVQEWEAAAQPAAEAGIRTAHLRTGIALSPEGGALEMMLPVFKMGLGGRIGSKDQYFSWIALDDLIGAYYHVLMTDDLEGPINATAPNPVTMETFTHTLADVLNRPAFLDVPTPVLRAVSGQAADEMLLTSLRVLPERLLQTSYDFRYPDLEDALRHLLGKTQESAS